MGKRKNQEDTRVRKAELFVNRVALANHVSDEETQSLFSAGLTQSVRINTLHPNAKEATKMMAELGWSGRQVSWCPEGYTIEKGYEVLRDSSLVQQGVIYIQNASSWIPVVSLDPQPGEEILDVCAAPGGKTSHIAARMKNIGHLIANDNSRPRLMKLQANMERLHAVAEFTLLDATKLTRRLGDQQFDKILLDAPCSGEGLINLNESKTLDSWSVAHIRRLASLQRQLILQAFRLLKPGGRLVYSTCTLAPEEDEMVLDWLIRRETDAAIVPISFDPNGSITAVTEWNEKQLSPKITYAKRIIPQNGNEAFFTCVVEKVVH